MTAVTRPIAPTGSARLLGAPPAQRLGDHLARLGPLPAGDHLVQEIERAGLRGRGGASFPTAKKLAAVAAGRRPLVVVNGTEGEPASAKDKTLLRLAPHLVIDGAVLAAEAVGADSVTICVDRTAPAAVAAVDAAIEERRHARLDRVAVSVETTPARYLTGEESALVHWLNGGDAKPTTVPPRPFERGVNGRPTLVQNVETCAHIALIARFGADWFRAEGTPADPGTTLLTISGAVRSPGVFEVPFGTPMATALDWAGCDRGNLRAVLVGGYFGTWLPASVVDDTLFTAESLQRVGAALGCGVVVALPWGACGLAETARVARWFAGQSAGQCGPCVFGLDAIASAMETIVRGDHSGIALRKLERWLEIVPGRGACKLPDGAARFVASALGVFAEEVALHRHRQGCPVSEPVLPLPVVEGWR